MGSPQPLGINIIISNLDGQIINTLHTQLLGGCSQTLTWDASAENSGIYFYKATLDDGNFASGKLVKM